MRVSGDSVAASLAAGHNHRVKKKKEKNIKLSLSSVTLRMDSTPASVSSDWKIKEKINETTFLHLIKARIMKHTFQMNYATFSRCENNKIMCRWLTPILIK